MIESNKGMDMNKEQEALNMLDQAVSQLQATRDLHFKLQQAVKTLQDAIKVTVR